MHSARVAWVPDESLFERVNGVARGIRNIEEALEAVGLSANEIITSKHPAVRLLRERLRSTLMPNGFEQHQLPILLFGEDVLCFITTGLPNAEFPEHRHLQNDGIRVVVSGSIVFQGTELTPGDWMFVPRGTSYSFTAGKGGCTLFHNYPQNPPPKAPPDQDIL